MISRKDRIDAANLITAFLSCKLNQSHWQFWRRVYLSHDSTVKYACEILSEFYDGYEDDVHLMDKTEWDYLERVRLVLLSNAVLHRRSKCLFDLRRLLACIGVLAFLFVVFVWGAGWHLLLATSTLGLLIFLFPTQSRKTECNDQPYQGVIEPFTSFRQLEAVYRKTTKFQKNRFPKEWRDDNVGWGYWNWLINGFLTTVCVVTFMTLSPLILFILALPDCEPEFTVIAA